MTEIRFAAEKLSREEQEVVAAGFTAHTLERGAPLFTRSHLAWRAHSDEGVLVGVLTGCVLWDWLYIDELWVDASLRGTGLGRRLMVSAEAYAARDGLVGLWLWTQSWQAADFYEHLGYERFGELPDFPRGHTRIGFRKVVAEGASLSEGR